MKLQQSLAAMLLMAAIGGHAESAVAPADGSNCPQSTVQESSSAGSASDHRDAPDGEDSAEDAAEAAAAKAWSAYTRSVIDALERSPDPRDLALAALLPDYETGDVTNLRPHTGDLLRRALPMAGDDRLVLWIATVQERGSASHYNALQRLREIEPDNAAVWLAVLNDAAVRKDEDAIGAALIRMAGAATFDGRSGELAKAATEIYRRYPPPPQLVRSLKGDAAASGEALAMSSALAATGAAGIPSFQHLVNACRVSAAGGRNFARRRDCGAAGRLLMLHSDTLVASRIGMVVLRVSKTHDETDLEAARNLDWIYDQYLSILPTDEGAAPTADWLIDHQRDWIETGSELEAMRRSIARAGIAPTPPGGWIDGKSAFSEERMRQDQTKVEQASTQN